ncbi:ATP-dependent RNA helicase DBP6 [Colletotrichum tofieldiae]|nr:ATP-dependent RNA helicase DBP6 [Colletotrichum tofieldiae]
MYARYVPSKKTKEAPRPAEASLPPPPAPSAPEPSSIPADDGLVTGGSTASPYARFVPSKSSKPRASLANVTAADTDGLSPATKRKHQVSAEAEEETPVKKKSRKSEDAAAPDEGAATPKKSKKEKRSKDSKQDDEPIGDAMDTRDEGARVTEPQEKEAEEKKRKKGAPDTSTTETSAEGHGAEEPKAKKDKSKKKKDRDGAEDEDDKVEARHKGVLAKATKYLKKAADAAQTDAPEKMDVDEEAEEVEEHGLEPLPQPEPVSLDTSKPSYETLPHWLAAPTRVAPDTRTPFADIGINPKAAQILETKGFTDAFAVQTAAIPCSSRPGDLLIAAATGSGKTLAYALPIVRDISQGTVTRLRALVVLPTRELVRQAQEVFELCAGAFDGRDQKRARIGISIGSQQLKHEQAALVEKEERYDPEAYRAAHQRELEAWKDVEEQTAESEDAAVAGSLPDHVVDYASKVDVLICTPGRLVEHINLTPGFSLDYVRWLVVDEADKLLAQSFQGWLDVVMPKLRTNKFSARDFPDSNLTGVRKVVLSATLTRDLSLLSGLQLRRPQLIVLEGDQADGTAPIAEHILPTLLKESAIRVHDANLKPLYLIDLLLGGHLMSETASKTSNESALRLSRLISLLHPSLAPSIATLTSTQKTSDRRRALRAFAGRRLRLLVASDLVARGIDLPLLDNVVNYDLPASAAGYVHRVGRTARAGRAGAAWTLVEDGESGCGIRRASKVERLRIGDPETGGFGDERVREYEDALEKLGKEAGEARRQR